MQDSGDKLGGREFHLAGGRAWIAVILAILVAMSGYSLFRLSREDQQRAELLRTNQALQASLDQAKSDLKAAADKLGEANTHTQFGQVPAPLAQPEPVLNNTPENPATVKPVHKIKKATGSHPPASAGVTKDPRWEEMDAKLANQQQQIESTKSDIAKTREDLEGRLGTTRDELNGAIAKTHDEVEDLRRRGERNIYEFDLNKSSEFARTGPVSLSLRKANVKRKYFDIALIVDDQKVEKKHVNLYEPLWISVPGHPEPVQVVVNSITKDNVKGYLSESKYKKSELASNDGARSTAANSNAPNSGTPQAGPAAADKGFKLPLEQQ
jgi:type II secretory pathway pseudopilin PulG